MYVFSWLFPLPSHYFLITILFFLGLLYKCYALFTELFTYMHKYIIGFNTQVRQNMVIFTFWVLVTLVNIIIIPSLYIPTNFILLFCFKDTLSTLCMHHIFFIPYSLDRFIFYLTYNIKLLLSKLKRKTATCVIICGENKSFTLVWLILITFISYKN